MRYYFNIKDGKTMLDKEGIELDNLYAVKNEAVQSSADLLKDLVLRISGPVSLGCSG
jgi:hypothetical protein